jgi:hypothetical protein
VNDIGRQFFDPHTGEFEEIEVGDGTRAWRKSAAPFQGAAPVGVVLGYSYRDANGTGLAVKAIPVMGGQ